MTGQGNPHPTTNRQWGPGDLPGDISPSEWNHLADSASSLAKTAAQNAAAAQQQAGKPPGFPGHFLTYEGAGGYRLSEAARKKLVPFFSQWNFDPTPVTFHFAELPPGTQGITPSKSRVLLDRDIWEALGPVFRLQLLTHELVHTAQYEKLGHVPAWLRFLREETIPGSKIVPIELRRRDVSDIYDLTDTGFSLEQIAYRIDIDAPQP